MAYNNFFPAGYQPVYPQSYPQGYPQNPQQNFQPQQNSGIVWVQGIEGAKAHPVAPGQAVLLMDSDSNCLYLKSADQTGMPSLRIFDYKERTNMPQEPKNDDLSAFARKEDLSVYVTKDELKKAISDIRRKKGKDDE
jgi:hypothetical protein